MNNFEENNHSETEPNEKRGPRPRSANFSYEEHQRLTQIIEVYKDTILCPKIDSLSWHRKEMVWKKIENEFNKGQNGKVYRTAKQLKIKFENLKKAWRRSKAPRPSLSDNEDVFPSPLDDMVTGGKNNTQVESNKPTIKIEEDTDEEPNEREMSALNVRHRDELHKQELRHREEEHALKMASLEARNMQDQQEHLMRMDEYRFKIRLLKRKCKTQELELEKRECRDADCDDSEPE